jgi:hypothetical protein
MNLAQIMESRRRMLNEYLGADVTIEDSERCSPLGGNRFPIHRISWRTGDRRHHAYVEPVIKFREVKMPWPFGIVSRAYEDEKETLARMRLLVQSTLETHSQVTQPK